MEGFERPTGLRESGVAPNSMARLKLHRKGPSPGIDRRSERKDLCQGCRNIRDERNRQARCPE